MRRNPSAEEVEWVRQESHLSGQAGQKASDLARTNTKALFDYLG